MKMQRTTKPVLLASTVVFGFCIATATYAADVTKLVADCANCHGIDGASTIADIPIIGGYSEPSTADSLTEYKNKERPCPETEYLNGDKKGQKSDMCKITKDMNDADIKLIAKHFAGLKFIRAKQEFDPALADKGKQIHKRSCDKCHTEGGSVASDDAGMLAGQWMPYLRSSLKEFRSGERVPSKKMKPKIEKLEPADLEALVNYYGSFK